MVEMPHTIKPNPFTGGLGGVRLRVAMRVNARDWQRTLSPLIQGEVGVVSFGSLGQTPQARTVRVPHESKVELPPRRLSPTSRRETPELPRLGRVEPPIAGLGRNRTESGLPECPRIDAEGQARPNTRPQIRARKRPSRRSSLSASLCGSEK